MQTQIDARYDGSTGFINFQDGPNNEGRVFFNITVEDAKVAMSFNHQSGRLDKYGEREIIRVANRYLHDWVFVHTGGKVAAKNVA